MSFKAKNLTYESEEPAFLRRLRGDLARGDVDRHEHPIPRPKRAAQYDAEDDPTYVIEGTGKTLSKAEYDALVSGEGVLPEKVGEGNGGDGTQGEEGKEKEGDGKGTGAQRNLTEVGVGQKKRKAGRMIGGEGEKGPEDGKDGETATRTTGTAKDKTKSKPKKKPKKTKLSFDEEE